MTVTTTSGNEPRDSDIASSPADMRERIKSVATEMLVRHGYLGLRFQQIADILNITRGNIHYHFGTKQAMMEEVVDDYVSETINIFQGIWLNPDLDIGEKIDRTMLANKNRYLQFNPDGKTVNAWSLIARMRAERDAISSKAKDSLEYFVRRLEELMVGGVRMAVENGELNGNAPVEQIAYHIVTICNSSDPITRDAGSFDRLVHLYTGFYQIIKRAFDVPKPPSEISMRKAIEKEGKKI